MKRFMGVFLAVCLLLSFAGCAKKPAAKTNDQPTPEPDRPVVGICLPEESQQWKENAQMLREELQALGFEVKTEYAQNDPQMQLKQIKALAEEQVVCLVVAPADAMALTQELEESDVAGIPVVAYDRQLQDLEVADAAVGFDYFAIGQSLGEYIVSAKELGTAKEPLSVEFIMGSAEDDRAVQLHAGLLQSLQPYLDAGSLVCPSGRIGFADTYVLQEDSRMAAEKLSKCLSDHYEKAPLDILCVASDDLAAACEEALLGADYTEENWPLITGQGGLPQAIRQIIDGKQTVTVYKDRAALTKACAQQVNSLVTGAMISDGEKPQFQNVVVDIKNYEKLLIKTGIYEKQDLK